MAKVNLSQAAKLVGKNRTTIWRHISTGKLSIERDRDGLPLVETSELIRVYGELQPVATPKNEKKQHKATPSYEDLLSAIDMLIKEQSEMRKEITSLTNRLVYKHESPSENRPENDPLWPKNATCIADIVLRNEIKNKYNKGG
ncbi:hypothetical protein BCU84_19495 [Shewanella sp. 10N.286.51.B7]|uniref:hypothetical protein n=1 Tax=Shewanella sp. 10N.286.51.B7 TaxID=1880836 RepID=UPI000C85D9FF|nr:hypothetical protein [Shewanella sp. 10N.286.51.B7]PMG73004.1 hypothetical protein BCU84_19495 [Shewanella sp. 10N.286.51.B7]